LVRLGISFSFLILRKTLLPKINETNQKARNILHVYGHCHFLGRTGLPEAHLLFVKALGHCNMYIMETLTCLGDSGILSSSPYTKLPASLKRAAKQYIVQCQF